MQENGETAPEHPLEETLQLEPDAVDALGQSHRATAVEANNAAWELLDGRDLGDDEMAELLARAHAAAYHWARATEHGPANAARADWLLSRAYAVVNEPGLALRFADRCSATVEQHGLVDFDLAYAREAQARALAAAGRFDEASETRERARAVPIADDEDRALFLADLDDSPWFGLVP